ncbi:hypothetical protein B0H14DRAFT_2575305 [Mycena olivaceomarginata]|nr:hypothetical protein B0H14DRAFT_2575305 [Mycena olivaceomarginata]
METQRESVPKCHRQRALRELVWVRSQKGKTGLLAYTLGKLERDTTSLLAFQTDYMRNHALEQPGDSRMLFLEQQIQIQQCKVIYVGYQSEVDWRSTREILWCKPHFHSAPQFNSVIYEDNDDPLTMGRHGSPTLVWTPQYTKNCC